MSENKTQPGDASVGDFISAVLPARRQTDALLLDGLFRRITGWEPRMWGASIVGYGGYHYRYASGREGDFLATGFAPRKASQVLYIMSGFEGLDDTLSRLGKYRSGRACLYVNKLDDIHLAVLEDLIRSGLDRLGSRYHLHPT